MTEASRKIVQKDLDQAFASALSILQVRVQALPPESLALALQCAEGIRRCLKDLADASPGAMPAHQEALIRLIFSHGDRELVEALREYAEVLHFHLVAARDRLLGPPERKGS